MLSKPLKVTTGFSSPDRRWMVIVSLLVWSFNILHPECSAEELVAFKDHLDAMLVAMLLGCNLRVFVEAKYIHNSVSILDSYSASRVFALFFSRGSRSYS